MSKTPLFRLAALALATSLAGNAIAADATGAGASFVYPVMSKWSADYAKATGKKTAADGTLTSSPLQSKTTNATSSAPGNETPEQELRRLRLRVAELEVETTKLTTEREILQRAAKYFAGETRW